MKLGSQPAFILTDESRLFQDSNDAMFVLSLQHGTCHFGNGRTSSIKRESYIVGTCNVGVASGAQTKLNSTTEQSSKSVMKWLNQGGRGNTMVCFEFIQTFAPAVSLFGCLSRSGSVG